MCTPEAWSTLRRTDSRTRLGQTLKAVYEPFGQGLMAQITVQKESMSSGWAHPYMPVDSSSSREECGQRRARVLDLLKLRNRAEVLSPWITLDNEVYIHLLELL